MAEPTTEVATLAPVADTPEQEPDTEGSASRYLRPDQLLRKWAISLTNVSDPGILGKMSEFAYDERRIAQGIELHEKVTGLFAKQKQEYGEQLEASDALSATFDTANAAYMRTVKIARIAFEDDTNAVAALLLSGARSKVVSTWAKQADTFYRNLLATPSFLGKMAFYGYTPEKLRDEHELVGKVIAADAKHKKERGESQEATAVRDKALAELGDWMSKFYRVAKIACAQERQWLEKIGLKE